MPIQHTTLAAALLFAGCMTAEPDDPGAVDSNTDGLAVVDLADGQVEVAMPVVDERTGAHRLVSTAYNLNILRSDCHHGLAHLLDWSCPSTIDGKDAHFVHKHEVPDNATEVADNHNFFDGECVSLVKAAAKSDVVTADWRKGRNVFDGLPAGTAIATFFASDGGYEGHTAILLGYVEDHGHIVGMRIADQNWNGRTVKRHVIDRQGSGVSNANNYFAVVVP